MAATAGDIVDNAFTLKRLAREKGRLVLKPENKAYSVLRPEGSRLGGGRPKEDAEIYGVVVGLVRKYK